MRTLVAALIAAALVPLSTASASAEECPWWVTELPLPDGYTVSNVENAAEGGWFVGTARRPGEQDEVVRWHNDEVEVLGRAFDTQTALLDINASGDAVGAAPPNGPDARAVVHRNGEYEFLAETESKAVAINAAGDVLGYVGQDVVVWPASGGVRVVDIGPGYGWRTPVELDDQGNVLVNALRDGGFDAVVVRQDGTLTKLAPIAAGRTTTGADLKSGRVVGFAEQLVNGMYENVPVEWNTSGQLVRRLAENVSGPLLDSGNAIAGTVQKADGSGELSIWRDGVRALIVSSTYNDAVALTDDGVLAVTMRSHDWSNQRAQQFKRSC